MTVLVDSLRATGVTVGIATSKPTPIAERVLDAMDWRSSLHVLAGATMDSSRRATADVIASRSTTSPRAGTGRALS